MDRHLCCRRSSVPAYEDFTEGVLDEEEYAFAKKAYDEQYADLSRRLDEAVQRKVKFAEAMSEDNKWLTLMKSVSGATKLSQELVDESIELVKVHNDGSIELVMKYGDRLLFARRPSFERCQTVSFLRDLEPLLLWIVDKKLIVFSVPSFSTSSQ